MLNQLKSHFYKHGSPIVMLQVCCTASVIYDQMSDAVLNPFHQARQNPSLISNMTNNFLLVLDNMSLRVRKPIWISDQVLHKPTSTVRLFVFWFGGSYLKCEIEISSPVFNDLYNPDLNNGWYSVSLAIINILFFFGNFLSACYDQR